MNIAKQLKQTVAPTMMPCGILFLRDLNFADIFDIFLESDFVSNYFHNLEKKSNGAKVFKFRKTIYFCVLKPCVHVPAMRELSKI